MKKLFSILMILTATILLYACVKKISVKVDNKELTYKLGTTLDKIDKPKKELEILDHWLVNGQKVSNDYTLKQGDNITAVWRSKKFFTVKFDNILEPIEEQVIREDMLVSKPTNPIKKYYVFTGWKLDGQEFDFTKHISSDITLTASWHSIGAPMKKVYISVDGVKKEAQGYYVEDLPIPEIMKGGYFTYWSNNGKQLNATDTLSEQEEYKAECMEWIKIRYIIYDKAITNDKTIDLYDGFTYQKYYIAEYNESIHDYPILKGTTFKSIENFNYIDKVEAPQGYKMYIVEPYPNNKKGKIINNILHLPITVNIHSIECVIYKD